MGFSDLIRERHQGRARAAVLALWLTPACGVLPCPAHSSEVENPDAGLVCAADRCWKPVADGGFAPQTDGHLMCQSPVVARGKEPLQP